MESDFIGLNIGGIVYKASRTTLTSFPESLLAQIVGGHILTAKDDQGNYLIDRDNVVFRHILNFLRCKELVLPDGFNELSLLEREADFYKLESLKTAVRSLVNENIGLNIGGKIFKTTRKTLSRDDDSFFTEMLSGGTTIPRDAQGNFVIDRNGDKFGPVLEYLRLGILLQADGKPYFRVIKSEAEFFQLKILQEHIKSIQSMYDADDKVFKMHLYYHESGFCAVYTNKRDAFGKSSFLPLSPQDFDNTFGGVQVVSFTLDKTKRGTAVEEEIRTGFFGKYCAEYPTTKEDLMRYIGHKTQNWNYKSTKLSRNWTQFYY